MASTGNFCTWSPLLGIKDDGSKGITLSNGNCNATHSHNGIATLGTQAVKSGKWYWEVHYSASSDFSDGHLLCGWQSLKNNVDFAYIRQQPGSGAGAPDRYNWGSHLMVYRGSGTAAYQGGYLSSYNDVNNDTYNGAYNLGLRVATAGKILQYAGDFDNNKLYFGIDNTWYSLANAGTGTDAANTASGTFDATYGWSIESTWQGHHWTPAIWFSGASSGSVGIGNWGQDSSFAGTKSTGTAAAADGNGFGDFFYAPPSGYNALCSANLPISTDIDPAETDDNFPQKQCGVVTYTGDGSARTISGLGFQPDLIWAKTRNTTSRHYLVDSSRGFTKYLHSEDTYSEGTSTATGTSAGVTSATSDGFVIGGALDYVNYNGRNFVAWCWRANGGTTATNTSGDITSTVQANQAAGFSIVQWTANATSSVATTVGHGLSKAPEFVITKSRESSSNWCVTHTGLSSTSHMLFLNTNAVESDKSGNGSMSANTSTVFSVNATDGSNAPNGDAMIAYCWHSVEGYSKFGKYTGNADADGAVIHTGFRPRILIIRVLNVASDGWLIYDTERETFNHLNTVLKPHDEAADYSNAAFKCDILSNGFKLRSSDNAVNGTSYDPYVYMAWGDKPFKYNNTLP